VSKRLTARTEGKGLTLTVGKQWRREHATKVSSSQGGGAITKQGRGDSGHADTKSEQAGVKNAGRVLVRRWLWQCAGSENVEKDLPCSHLFQIGLSVQVIGLGRFCRSSSWGNSEEIRESTKKKFRHMGKGGAKAQRETRRDRGSAERQRKKKTAP